MVSPKTRVKSEAQTVGLATEVMPEGEFRQIQGQVVGADVVEGSDHATLQSDQKFSMLFVWTLPRT